MNKQLLKKIKEIPKGYFRGENSQKKLIDLIEKALNQAREGKILELPEHEGELSITHNGHKSNYETVENYLEWLKADDEDISPEERKKAIETKELWECQWYPNTPVGFNKVYASSLEKLQEILKSL